MVFTASCSPPFLHHHHPYTPPTPLQPPSLPGSALHIASSESLESSKQQPQVRAVFGVPETLSGLMLLRQKAKCAVIHAREGDDEDDDEEEVEEEDEVKATNSMASFKKKDSCYEHTGSKGIVCLTPSVFSM